MVPGDDLACGGLDLSILEMASLAPRQALGPDLFPSGVAAKAMADRPDRGLGTVGYI